MTDRMGEKTEVEPFMSDRCQECGGPKEHESFALGDCEDYREAVRLGTGREES